MFNAMRGADTLVPGLPSRPTAGPGATQSNLSTLDRALIRILQSDGRCSFAAIGRELGVAEKVVRRRVNELLDDHVIHITTVSDPALLGYKVPALVGINIDGRRDIRVLLQSVAEVSCVDYAVITTGRYDMLVEVLCRDLSELLSVVNGELVGTPGIGKVEIFPYLLLHYQEPAWEAAQTKLVSGKDSARRPLDATDRKIMGVLNEDGRLPFGLIGERLGVSESQVRKRVARLLEERTMRVTALANPRTLGFEMLVWVGITCRSGHSLVELADTLARIDSITYVAVTAGRFDIFAEAVCRSMDDVMHVLDSEIRRLTAVDDTELLICLDLFYRAVKPLEP
jgi:Lrp/AsnC family transcriptional regulator for asnA, asnC and gidA